MSLLFRQGAQIEDKYQLFKNGEDNEHNRFMKFEPLEQIDRVKVKEYITIAANLPSPTIAKKTKTSDMYHSLPEDFKEAPEKEGLLEKFESMTNSQKKKSIYSG